MTDITNYNAAGQRQITTGATLTVDASEFGATSATAALVNLFVLPPGSIVIDCSLSIEDLFDGGGNDTVNVGVKADLNGDGDYSDTVEGTAETDADGLLAGTTDNAGAVAAKGGALGVWIGRKMPYGGTVTATYTPAAAVAATGTVRINLSYLVDGKSDSIYDG